MTPLTLVGWILSAAMWVAGPISGYTALNLIVSTLERKMVDRGDAVAFGLFGGLMAVATVLLMFVDAL